MNRGQIIRLCVYFVLNEVKKIALTFHSLSIILVYVPAVILLNIINIWQVMAFGVYGRRQC